MILGRNDDSTTSSDDQLLVYGSDERFNAMSRIQGRTYMDQTAAAAK